MKKLVKEIALTALVCLGIGCMGQNAAYAETNGAITNHEQAILDNLQKGITVSNKTFYFETTNTVQAENYLKSHQVPVDNAKRVTKNIDAARTLLEKSNVNAANATNLKAVVKLLSKADLLKLQAYIQDAAAALGLKAVFTSDGIHFVDAETGTTVAIPNDTAIKNTGSSYITSLIALSALATLATGAGVVATKKKQHFA